MMLLNKMCRVDDNDWVETQDDWVMILSYEM